MKLQLGALIFAMLAFAACTVPPQTSAPPTIAAEPTEPPTSQASPMPGVGNPFDLTNSKWILVSIMQNGAVQTTVPGTKVTLEFAGDGTFGGDTGCNAFGGRYQAQGEILSMTNIFATERACIEQEKMQVESAYLEALSAARLFEMRGDELTITFADGGGKLTFHKQV
jgi:heat shock protein HslJ